LACKFRVQAGHVSVDAYGALGAVASADNAPLKKNHPKSAYLSCNLHRSHPSALVYKHILIRGRDIM
jgi:hypothetical protein